MPEKTGAVRLHRVLLAPAERIYKAFTDKSALECRLPTYGFTGTIHDFDIRVGGGYRMSFTNFGTGHSHSFAVEYLELVPYEGIPSVIPEEMCYLGWQESLEQVARLVEPNIPDDA